MQNGKLSSDPVYTLGIVSKLSGISVHSIRQYVDKGLILPYVTDTNRHLFSDIDVNRLKKIKSYIDQGINIAGLKCLYAQIPGYYLKSCSDKVCDGCTKFSNPVEPCWMASVNNTECNIKDCRSCDVYALADPVRDLNQILPSKSNTQAD